MKNVCVESWRQGISHLKDNYRYLWDTRGSHWIVGYRPDLLVSNTIVVELKAVSLIEPIHEAQLLTYMKLGGWKLGLLINFNVPLLKNGIRRRIL